MKSSDVIIKTKLGLNKLDSNDYQNVEVWKIQQNFNKAILGWVRRQYHGDNSTREGKESSIIRVDDLQILLSKKTLSGLDKGTYYETSALPKDYLYYSRLTVNATKDNCVNIPLISDLIEEANVTEYLGDWSMAPSFQMEQLFHTIFGNKINIYHNGDFKVESSDLLYYRKPQYVQFPTAPQSNGTIGVDMNIEWKDDIVELLIEETIKIISGDIGYMQRYGIADKSVEQNN